jgi:hypothetical protein
MHRALLLLPLLLSLVVPMPAWAGGWAVVTLDEIPAGLEEGDGGPYQVGYTVLQHGLQPLGGLNTSIAIRSAAGEAFEFPGRPVGDVGHYVAEVRFPSVGEWTWEARPGAFPPQALGTVTIVPKHLAGEGVSAQDGATAHPRPLGDAERAASPFDPFRGSLPVLAVSAWLLFVWSMVVVMRRRTMVAGVRGNQSS